MYSSKTCTGNFRLVVRSIFAHAQISITTETLQPPWLTETQGDGWVSGTLGRDMAANPLQALIMHSLRMFLSVHKGACADFVLTLQTTNLKFPVYVLVRAWVSSLLKLVVHVQPWMPRPQLPISFRVAMATAEDGEIRDRWLCGLSCVRSDGDACRYSCSLFARLQSAQGPISIQDSYL